MFFLVNVSILLMCFQGEYELLDINEFDECVAV